MGLNADTLDTCFIKLKLDYSKFVSLATGEYLCEERSIRGLTWGTICYPRGVKGSNGAYLSLASGILGRSKNTVKAIFHAFVMGKDCTPSLPNAGGSSQFMVTYKPDGAEPGLLKKFMKRSELESNYLVDGCITFICGITIIPGDHRITVPASDLGNHLGNLLDCTDGSDVSFSVGGETFRAHRAVLAARSPVFKAQLFGSMADAKMDRITLHDIQPATFQILLRFMYSDALPTDKELDSSSSSSGTAVELLQHLLAAADMYHLDRLKLMCAQKLCDRLTVENVATVLGCAETHNCSELKKQCMDFFVVEKNFKKAVLTKGYLWLMQGYPSIIDEIGERVQT